MSSQSLNTEFEDINNAIKETNIVFFIIFTLILYHYYPIFPDEDPEEELERCSIHYLLEILARSPIYPEEEVDDD